MTKFITALVVLATLTAAPVFAGAASAATTASKAPVVKVITLSVGPKEFGD